MLQYTSSYVTLVYIYKSLLKVKSSVYNEYMGVSAFLKALDVAAKCFWETLTLRVPTGECPQGTV